MIFFILTSFQVSHVLVRVVLVPRVARLLLRLAQRLLLARIPMLNLLCHLHHLLLVGAVIQVPVEAPLLAVAVLVRPVAAVALLPKAV